MTSINFNASATTALRTLQQTNTALSTTQNRVSTGLKIGEAKDNAAYWAITTTLKSDNKALSTVKDALSLGAATVDTAYQGLNKAKDVLDEIKSKLTAATQAGVDRGAIQNEITALQDQLKSIATSSTFSGENWLSVDSSDAAYNATKTIVASFSRSSDGSVAIGTVKVDTANTLLFDSSSQADGILDSTNKLVSEGVELTFGGVAANGNISKAGLSDKVGTAGSGTGSAATFTLATFAAADYKIGDTVKFDISLDGGKTSKTVSATLSFADAATNAGFASAIETAIEEQLGAGKVTVAATGSGSNDIVITTAEQGADVSLKIGAVTAVGNPPSTLGLPAGAVPGTVVVGPATPTLSFSGYDVSTASVGDSVTLKMQYGSGGSPVDVVVVLTAAMLNPTNGGATGSGAFATALKTSLDAATSGTFTVTATGANFVITTATAQSTTANDSISITAATTATNAGTLSTLAGVDINGTGTTSISGTGVKAEASFSNFRAVTLDADDTLSFAVTTGAGTQTVSLTKAVVDAALGTNTGKVGTAADMAKVLNSVLTSSVASVGSDGSLAISTKLAGAGQTVEISSVVASAGDMSLSTTVEGISVADIDVTDATLASRGADTEVKQRQAITAYINVVNAALNKVTSAAANLGAVSSRIDLQDTFVSTLIDTIDKGVSGLIDADLSEESTRLQALQTKQQLGIQALSIANTSQQNILSLFR